MHRRALWIPIAILVGCADGTPGESGLRPPPEDVQPSDGFAALDARFGTFDVGAETDGPSAELDVSRADTADLPTDALVSIDADDLDADDLDANPVDAADANEDLDVAADSGADLPQVDMLTPDVAPPDGPLPDVQAPDVSNCADELCNGLDDDCDGSVDEGSSCGPYVASHCIVYAGWSDSNRAPRGVTPSWSTCPPSDRQEADNGLRCTGTRRDGRFARLRFNGDVGGDDALAVALRCADPDDPNLATYIQSHCAFFLGWADNNRGIDGVAAWGACPNAVASNIGNLRCTSTGYDGNFRALDMDGNVDENDDLGVAWVCRDAADPERAAALSAAVSVFIGWADNNRAPPDTSAIWGPCPGAPNGEVASQRCTSTFGDQRFHRLDLDGDVDGNDALGFAIRAR